MDKQKEPKKDKKKLGEFPSSKDKDFWGEEADINTFSAEEPEEKYELPLVGHDWKQKGPDLVCKSCPLDHSVRIGLNKQLIGIENGKPLFKKVEL